MVQRKPTPEEQLLKLIENPGSASAGSPAAASGKTALKTGKPAFKLPDFKKAAAFLDYFSRRRGQTPRTGGGIKIKIGQVNRLLMALVAAAFIYLIVDVAFFQPKPSDFLADVGTSEPVYPSGPVPRAVGSELAAYQEPLTRRNPFLAAGTNTPPADAPASLPVSAVGAPTGQLASVIQGLKLVGISLGQEPLAMIEETESGRTYFLKKGQEFKGVKVQNVTKEKVVLTHEGQEAELF